MMSLKTLSSQEINRILGSPCNTPRHLDIVLTTNEHSIFRLKKTRADNLNFRPSSYGNTTVYLLLFKILT